jgi:actin-related protein
MFETFNVKGLFIGVQATLALYAQIAGPNSSVDI